jgi:pimeloyl-ACP methyl ester carboxylesterase
MLRAKGLRVVEVDNPLTSLADDIAATKAALAAQAGPVVLVGHSWGGVVIGEAGDDPKVKALVFVAAFGLDKGESITSVSANTAPPPGIKALRPDASGRLTVDPTVFPEVFASGVPTDEALQMAKDQVPTSASIFDAKAEVAAWRLKPTYYQVSAADEMIPPAAEAFFAKRMGATTITLQTGHASMVSDPHSVAKLILRAVDGN